MSSPEQTGSVACPGPGVSAGGHAIGAEAGTGQLADLVSRLSWQNSPYRRTMAACEKVASAKPRWNWPLAPVNFPARR